MKFRRRLLPTLLLFLSAAVVPVQGYLHEKTLWPLGKQVVMQLGVGSSAVALQDGFLNFNASAADAAAIWNGYLDFISFTTVSSATVPQVSGDGANSAFFSGTVFGDAFGEDVLAVTVILSPLSQVTTTAEADVVFNAAYHYNSYRGPLQKGVWDFHRVALHEFGHVLGLNHVQDTAAIMNPVITNLDHLGSDDMKGVESLYQAKVTQKPGTVYPRAGEPFDYSSFAANNQPTSWTATGLPPGYSINSTTGEISGITPASGLFNPFITAHGVNGDAHCSFPIKVEGFDQVPGLQKIIPSSAYSIVADPVRPRIYLGGFDGVDMVDANTLTTTRLFTLSPVTQSAAFLSMSADNLQLLVLNYVAGKPLLRKIDLASFSVSAPITIPPSASSVVGGPNGFDYEVNDNTITQFKDATGAVTLRFGQTYNSTLSPILSISPDQMTLYLTELQIPRTSAYDISTSSPVLLSQVNTLLISPTLSVDGKTLLAVGEGQDTIVELDPLTLQQVGTFKGASDLAKLAPEPDGHLFATEYRPYGSDSLLKYDVSSGTKVASAWLGGLSPNENPLSPDHLFYNCDQIVVDSAGKHVFSLTHVLPPNYDELWVFSTALEDFPPPPPTPTEDLLNISTRSYVGTGNDVMIAGFIVQGPAPKKILLRGLGPSLPLTGAIDNPVVTLYDSTGKQLATNDNWATSLIGVTTSQLPPSSPRESAIVTTLAPGSYTAVVEDKRSQAGLSLIEVYDLDAVNSTLANISTRGAVGTGDDVMIGGFIIGGKASTNVLVRALGPSLSKSGISGCLTDPVLEIHDATGKLIMSNDNWRATQEAAIAATGIPPANDLESAIVTSLAPGNYTAIVRGNGSATGVALVEVYNLDSTATNN